jgi:DNA-binding transcriptional LysR family regulator
VPQGSETLIRSGRLRTVVLVAVVDRAGRGGTREVRAAFEAVERRYAERGHRLRVAVSAEIVAMPIMGASRSFPDRHTLFVSVQAVESDMLDGLIAHEVGHMLRTEEAHSSHRPEVYTAMEKEVRIPRGASEAFGQAFNHIQDIYADDLAFPIIDGTDGRRAYGFFAAWVDRNVNVGGKEPWHSVGLAASNGFAIGNLVRHRLIADDDPLWDRARAFDQRSGFEVVDRLAAFYANLPDDPDPQAFVAEVKDLASLMVKAATPS